VIDEKGRAAVVTEVSLILAAVFWGLNFVVTKYAADFLPPLIVVALQFASGGLLLLGIRKLLEPKGKKLARRDVLPMLGLGCFGIGAAQTAFTFGVSMTSAASAGLVFATAPVWGILLGLVLGRERPTLRGVLGIGLSILGVAMVFYGGSSGTGGDSLAGNLLALLAAVGIGAYAVFSLPLLDRYSPLAVATYSVLFGTFNLARVSTVLCECEVGGCGLWAVGGHRLLGHLRDGLRVRRLAEGHKPNRSQQGARLSTPHHLDGGHRGRRAPGREPQDKQAPGRGYHPRGRVPGTTLMKDR
jgi:EamA-like transporter family